MYVFCYFDETASLALSSLFVLVDTEYFVMSTYERDDRSMQRGNSNDQLLLVSEFLLPPLSSTEKGGILVVTWEKNGQGNAIYEAFLDSTGLLHTEWLLRSTDITNNKVCDNLHASVMASCDGNIPDIASYNYVNTQQDSAFFRKIQVLPKQLPAESKYSTDCTNTIYTIVGLLQVFVQYSGNHNTMRTCTVDLEFVYKRFDVSGQRESERSAQCVVHTEES